MKNKLQYRLIIESMGINFTVFEIEIERKYIDEVNDAIKCEKLYNDTIVDFGKLEYVK